ncbi:twin-arginine translocation signal domain-containing protein [Paludibacterium paludis]|uniref:Uncharacterized protein n=1 Tax=Paludibacterium paludis TaxID=1225769 RepID=A0A918UB91_9NEIS|nr:twin-arginine translocation signal domain-containing protein [Paludibacterium paludis]GGY20711.1 hypothetical protein GCM10011289_25420 [Paludibacterium paludis]
MATRRQFIKAGAAGALLLAGVAFLAAPEAERHGPRPHGAAWLTARDAAVLAVIAPVMLGVPGLPVAAVVEGVDEAVLALSAPVRAEVRQLLDILGHPWGRRWLAGIASPWSLAGAADVARFLDAWRASRFALLRAGYQALHALLCAAWYGNPASWARIGYQPPGTIMEFIR